MSRFSTPKRQLEVNKDNGEAHGLVPKRNKLEAPSNGASVSRSSSNSSPSRPERLLSPQFLSVTTEQMNICSEETEVEDLQRNCRFPTSSNTSPRLTFIVLPALLKTRNSRLQDIPAQLSNLRYAGTGPQTSYTPPDEDICFGMVRFNVVPSGSFPRFAHSRILSIGSLTQYS
jgi:hypothetical protein